MSSLVIDELANKWSESGVEVGDCLLVHSNIQRTMIQYRRAGYRVSPLEILESFIQAIGPRGTLLLPLFNFDFTSGVPFDIRHTMSQMGVLTEAARLHKDSVRTHHPVYSFAVIGKDAKAFDGVNNVSAYGEDSPFGLLKRLNGKIASLDLDDQNSMTFYHHVEEVKQVEYRYYKDFTGSYTDWAGNKETRTYKVFVRNLEKGVLTDVNPAGELMWKKGLYKGDRPKEKSGLRTIRATEMFDFVAGIIDRCEALGVLYSLKKK